MINEIEMNGRLMALAAQRDEYANRVVILTGMLAMSEAKIKDLETPPDSKSTVLKDVSKE